MSKAKTERYDVTVQGGGHGMTTDPLDGLEQLRRIIDEQPEPAPESVMLGLDYCYAEWVAERARHAEEVARLEERLAGSCEAEELRSGLEKLMADRGPRGTDAVSRDSLQALLDKVDARDSLLTLETIDSLHDQLRKVEGERDAERKHATEMEERALDLVRDLRLAQVELHALRSLLPDVRACAEYCRNMIGPPPGMPVEDYPLAPVALAARRILAALDSQGGEGE